MSAPRDQVHWGVVAISVVQQSAELVVELVGVEHVEAAGALDGVSTGVCGLVHLGAARLREGGLSGDMRDFAVGEA
jgi:hypothetical protein